MQISAKSWHYKLVEGGSRDAVPGNICPYMRRLVWVLSKWTAVIALIALMTVMVTCSLVAPLLWLVNEYVIPFLPATWDASDVKSHYNTFVAAGIAIYIIIGSVALWFGAGILWDKFKYRKRSYKVAPPKEPTLVGTYIESFRTKTCITLDFVDVAE